MTLHPNPSKNGVNISKEKYDQMKGAILESIEMAGEIKFMTDLRHEVNRKLGKSFEGSIGWYLTSVKLDLEARGLIERVPGKKPQYLRLVS
ncbi:MAG: hypothetical protein ISR89_10285 [Candidatus Marinimicrobia bacterium]|nr:hypothetical protein [Candidatus Neomarinimicrobiota bacterium]MBL7031539.1 hypothetical protein [Candidatus Neomarinimicrobiota bacterium]